MAADPFALMNRSLNRFQGGGGYPTKGGGRGRGRMDPNNPKDRERLRAMHPDFDDLMGNADLDYRTMCNQDANFAEKFRMPPVQEPAKSFAEHTNSVDAVCWGPESGTFMSASHDSTIKVWDAASGRCTKTLNNDGAAVFHCSVSPTLKHFVSCGSGETNNVSLWKWPEAKVASALEGHQRPAYHATFSSDGRSIASTDKDGLVVTHDLTRSSPTSSRQLHLGVSHGSSFCRQDSNLLCSVGNDSHVQMTDLRESHVKAAWHFPSMAANGIFRTSLCIPAAHDGHTIYAAEFVDATTIFSCGADHKLKRWDLRMAPWNAKSAEYLGHSAPLRSLAVSPDQRFIITGCEDGSCRVWRKDELGHVRSKLTELRAQLDKPSNEGDRRGLQERSQKARAHEQQLLLNGYGDAAASLNGHVSLVSGCAWQDDKENNRASILSCSWDQTVKLFQLNLKDLP